MNKETKESIERELAELKTEEEKQAYKNTFTYKSYELNIAWQKLIQEVGKSLKIDKLIEWLNRKGIQ